MLNLDSCRTLLSRLPIQDRETGAMVPFQFRYNQSFIHEEVKKHQQHIGGKIRVIIDKSRRVGGSSWADGMGVCHIAHRSNATAWIVACLAETAEELFRVPTDLVDNWPWPLPKPLTTYITYPHKEGDSYLTLNTAKSVLAGRGPTLSFLHLSEASMYPSGKSFMSLLPAVSDDPDTAIIIESTANGKVGQGETFWKMWEAAIRKDTEFLPIFLTWLNDPVCRRYPEGIKFANADADERDLIAIVACPDKCGRCSKCWKALCCLAWRKWALANICKGVVEDFRQDYPITWEESFYSTSFPAFTKDELRAARATVCDPVLIGRLEIDTSSYGQTGTGKPTFINDANSPLRVWRPPEPALHYYIGADAARGMGGDYTAVNVFCGQTGEQVCRYANRRTDPDALAKLLFLLGTWYNYAMIAIELTGNLGLWAQKVLRDTYKYRNLYRWRGRDDRTPGPRVIGSIGWETTSRTRDMMLAAFRGGIAHGKCKIRDAALLAQMDAAEMLDGRWEVPDDIHDDIMVSAMVAWIELSQWHTGFVGSEVKQLLGEEVSIDKGDEAKREVKNAKGDVDAAIRLHWAKIQRAIRQGGNKLELVEAGKGAGDNDRLSGI